MTLPSNAQVAAALRKICVKHVLFQGPPTVVAEGVLRVVRMAMAADGVSPDSEALRPALLEDIADRQRKRLA